MYNRWLATLGGGEKHSLAIAEVLSRYYPVEVLSHAFVSREKAARRLGLDLSRVRFTQVEDKDIHLLTSRYDLFFNVSHLDFFPSSAAHSIMLVYFPARLSAAVSYRQSVKAGMRRVFRLPRIYISPQTFDLVSPGSWAFTSGMRIELPSAQQEYGINLKLKTLTSSPANLEIFLSGDPMRHFSLATPGKIHHLSMMVRRPEQSPILTIKSGDGCDENTILCLCGLEIDLPRHKIYRRFVKPALGRIRFSPEFSPATSHILSAIDTYSAVWANSRFTRYWISKYWHRESRVLYPLVELPVTPREPKLPQILSVGRFFAGQHNKKHDVLIRAFKQLVDEGLAGWSLHLVGGVAEGEAHRQYFESLVTLSEGYPVFFHPDAPFDELLDLYARSTVYWHASGFGEAENLVPEKMEHFGISTVEAMNGGCVPIVINRGGQSEIVQDGRNGFLWDTLDELKQRTLQVIREPDTRRRLSHQAAADSTQYGRQQFERRLMRLLEDIGIRLP